MSTRSTDHPANTVVVGVEDRGPHSCDHAIRIAVAWASRRDLDVTLLSSVALHSPDDPATHIGNAHVRARRTSRLLRSAAQQAGGLNDPPVVVHTAVSREPAADALIAQSARAALVVVQRRSLGRWTRLHAGSVSARVAGQAGCPVLIVRDDDEIDCAETDVLEEGASDPQRGVLVAVDLRGHSEHAIAAAFEEASWRGVPLTALHAWQPVLPIGYMPPDYYEWDVPVPEAEKALAEALAGYAERYPDVRVDRQVRRGEVKPILDDAARQHALLVMARHTDEHKGQRNLGSPVRHLIERAHCPVLITPAARPVGMKALRARQGIVR